MLYFLGLQAVELLGLILLLLGLVIVGFFVALRRPRHYWGCPHCRHLNAPESRTATGDRVCVQCGKVMPPGWLRRLAQGSRARGRRVTRRQ